jgi:hypothetical protein
MTMSYELQELRNVFHGLESLYSTYLPKVDPVLIHDLLLREEEKSERAPFYMVEVFTKPRTNHQYQYLQLQYPRSAELYLRTFAVA